MAPAKILNTRALRRAGLGSFFRPVDLLAMGVAEPTLRRLVHEGRVEKVARGLYRLADAEPSEHYTLAAVCARVPRGVVCLLTALQMHGIGTRLSPEVWIGIPHGARSPKAEIAKVRIIRFSAAQLTTGIEPVRIDGVPTHITNATRTVVDCFRLSRLIDRETALEALREVLRARKSSPAHLLQVAASCGGAGTLRTALEVLGA